jgi:hypothetical protein
MYPGRAARRMLAMNLRCSLLAATAALLTLAGTADAASMPSVRDYDLRLSVSMKSNFSFNVKPTGCNGTKPSGWVGSGQELLEASSPKPVRVSVLAFKGSEIVMNRKDLKNEYELQGTSRRTGSMQSVICGETSDAKMGPCTGTKAFTTAASLLVGPQEKWTVSDTVKKMSDDLIPGCDDEQFDWDGASARTGRVFLDSARGSVAKLRKGKGTVTLTASTTEQCDLDYFGPGSCSTTWNYKLRLTPVKAARKRKR